MTDAKTLLLHIALLLMPLRASATATAKPLSSQLDLSHQLVTASLAVRSLSYSLFIYSPNTFST